MAESNRHDARMDCWNAQSGYTKQTESGRYPPMLLVHGHVRGPH